MSHDVDHVSHVSSQSIEHGKAPRILVLPTTSRPLSVEAN